MAFAMPPPLLPQQYAIPQAQNVPPTYYNNMYSQPQIPQLYAPNPQPSNHQPQTTPPQQTVSPISAPPTPTTISPTSHILFPKKGPVAKTLYTPAVLRPTENPRPKKITSFAGGRNSPSPLTPPGSLQSSMDSLDKPPQKHPQKQSLLSRRNTGDSEMSLEGVTSYEEEILHRDPQEPGYGRVTGFPTRIHWKADSTTATCNDATCNRTFTYFNRRHHCRRCGSIFCDTHSSNLIPLNQDAEFHPHGNRVRGCDSCWRDYTVWEIKRLEVQFERDRTRRGDVDEIPPSPALITSPVSVMGFRGESLFRKIQGRGILPSEVSPFQRRQSVQVASSVPGDWSWSTF